MGRYSIIDFVNFLLQRVYNPKPIADAIIISALTKVVKDVNYHFPDTSEAIIIERIIANQNELVLFLFRLGSELHKENQDHLKPQIHFLMKDLCCCEIYFNSTIDEGFYIIHGEGTVIGSRNTIGKGFMIHQNCTVGHKVNGSGNGNTIGNNVKMYCNASVLGSLTIGNNVTIGAHTMVNKNIKANTTVVSSSRLDYL
ncbi:hypothetical protein [Winogradskyella sp. UBA3174]|uniref:hypothetical protein n=1 Tax=Winogradskyella sp. UBA3174 TaxID=1947785 RepID=UPI0025D47AF7|nr:hypothetical protein [Winogradskyella sp. UBA3174]|tara:strand:+ start:71968 stop:72561 length:594 start_codon:yes stop_codon:yes gene_type:complete